MSNHERMLSVVMSVYNGEIFVHESIESILSQTFTDFELIIIDDGSTDNTWSIIKNYSMKDHRIKILQNKINLGLSKSLNLGIQTSNGRYIARQDADDISTQNRLEEQIDYALSNDEIGIIGTSGIFFGEDMVKEQNIPRPWTDYEIRWWSLITNPFLHTSVFCKKNLILKVGGYNENIEYAQDYDLWTRILDYTKGINLPIKAVKLRLHKNNVTKYNRKYQKMIISQVSQRMLKNILNYSPPAEIVQLLYNWSANNGLPLKFIPDKLNPTEISALNLLIDIVNAYNEKYGHYETRLKPSTEYINDMILSRSSTQS